MNKEKLLTNVECDITGSIKNKNEPMLSNDTIEKKKCSKCKDDLPLEMFRVKSNGKLNCYCKVCQPKLYHDWRVKNLDEVKKREKLRREKNKTRISERNKKYLKTWINKLKSRFTVWKNNARKRNISFDLTLEQIESMPLICHYTGNPLVTECNKQNTVSLDRIDSSKGYTLTNVVFCCVYINLMKHTLSYEQFINACNLVSKYNQSSS